MRDRPVCGTLEVRAAPDTSTPTIDGQRLRGTIPYGVESRDLGGWREVIAPGALRNAKMGDLVATVDHVGVPLGRFPNTLTIEDGDAELRWAVELPENRADVREAVERGDLRAASWRMVVARDEWRGNVRHVLEIAELRDVAVVTTPAYPAAAAELRHRPNEPEDPAVRPTSTPPAPGGLRVEDRTAEPPSIEARVLDAMRAVPQGEARDLTTASASAGPLTPTEQAMFLWDRLRDQAVVLASGVRVIPTDRNKITWPAVLGDVAAAFYDELDEITESDPDLDEIEAVPKAIKALVRGSSEAFEDSDPDLLNMLVDHLSIVLGLRLDRALLTGDTTTEPKGFNGLLNLAGVPEIDVEGDMANYDALVRAVGVLRGNGAPGDIACVMHPWTATHLDLLKEETTSNVTLARPDGLPPIYVTRQIGRDTENETSTVVLYATSQVAVVRRRDVTIEVDRSEEFSSDAVKVRGKLRATLAAPFASQVVVKVINAPAPDPSVIPEPDPGP